jgi:hypothetical protein
MSDRDPLPDNQPIGEVLSGLTLEPLPAGWTPTGVFVLVKCIDEEGDPSWVTRVEGLDNDEELLGSLTIQVELFRRRLISDWEG